MSKNLVAVYSLQYNRVLQNVIILFHEFRHCVLSFIGKLAHKEYISPHILCL